ncbi:YoaK family protein [Castellaniella sp.]|uniref:YoaK family protein n=1 Tax=Castellaniella sp. TaxID=1955812 RepID=UPI002AFF1C6C|nr:YoaK family protein [Castellaniella sp.]
MPVLRQLPRWAWVGTGILALIAGLVNAIGYLGFMHEPITNLTGNTTQLGMAISQGDWLQTAHWALTICAFVLGAAVSGMIVRQSTLQLGRRYGLAMLLESALLFAAVPFMDAAHPAGFYLASMAMGLQNGMVSAYSGAVIRTSHVTGIFTDLGMYLGHLLRGMPVDPLRLRLCGIVVGHFIIGSIAGALLFARLREHALLVPAALTGIGALGYGLYRWQAGVRVR